MGLNLLRISIVDMDTSNAIRSMLSMLEARMSNSTQVDTILRNGWRKYKGNEECMRLNAIFCSATTKL